MSAALVALLGLAGGVGSVLRYLLDSAVRKRLGGQYPWGTFVINVSGSGLLGLVTGLAGHLIAAPVALVAGTGLLGGYTTFSTASVETFRLLARGGALRGLAHGLGMLAACVLAAAVGSWLGR